MRETTKKLARKRHSLLGKKKRKKGESNKSIVGQHMHTLDHLGSERNRSIYPPTPYRKKTSCSCFRYTPVPASPAAAAVMEVNFPSTRRRRNLLGLCHLPPYDSRSLFFLFFQVFMSLLSTPAPPDQEIRYRTCIVGRQKKARQDFSDTSVRRRFD